MAAVANTREYTFLKENVQLTVTATPEEVDAWIHESNEIIEGHVANFVNRQINVYFDSKPEQALEIQAIVLCVLDRCMIHRIFMTRPIPVSLRAFILNPRHRLVGINIVQKLSILRANYHLGEPINGVDIMQWATRLGRGAADLDTLAINLFKNTVKKGRDSSNVWGLKKISHDNQRSACIDAFLVLKAAAFFEKLPRAGAAQAGAVPFSNPSGFAAEGCAAPFSNPSGSGLSDTMMNLDIALGGPAAGPAQEPSSPELDLDLHL